MPMHDRAPISLDDAVALSNDLADTRGIDEVRAVLRRTLEFDQALLDSEIDRALDALQNVVAFALSTRGDRAREWGAQMTKESIASRLGLGELVRPGGGR